VRTRLCGVGEEGEKGVKQEESKAIIKQLGFVPVPRGRHRLNMFTEELRTGDVWYNPNTIRMTTVYVYFSGYQNEPDSYDATAFDLAKFFSWWDDFSEDKLGEG